MADPHLPESRHGADAGPAMTPEYRRRQRRRHIGVSLFGVAMGGVLLVVGWRAMRDGTMVVGLSGSLPLTGGQACALAAVVIAASGWLLWRVVTGRQ